MRFLHKLAMAAGAACVPSLAVAEYYPYGAPATLPAPAQMVRPLAYNGAAYPAVDETVPAPTPAPEPYVPSISPYEGAVTSEEGCSTCQGGDCGMGDYGMGGWGCGMADACCCAPSWYGSLSALYMERNRPNPYQVSFDTTNPIGELILNVDTVGDWEAGFEVRVGKYIGCNSAVELSYWTLDNFGGQAFAYDPPGIGNLNTPFDFRSLNFNGVPVNAWFDGAQAHRLTRNDEIHNLELNFIHWPVFCNPCSRIQVSGLAGLRYFSFREGWEFATSDNAPAFGVDRTGEAYYNIDVDNDLFGVQLGGRASYGITQRLSVYAAPRAGVFWNSIDHHSRIVDGTGAYALNVGSDRDILSVLGQIDVGVNYQVTPCIGVWGGYRVVAISGIALADQQIPYLADDVFGIGDIDHNSNLVLHGAMAGVTVTF